MKLKNNKQALFSKSDGGFKFPQLSERVVVLLLVFGAVGSFIVFATHAATSSNWIEPENGTLSGNVSGDSDAGASGGSFVKFGQQPYQDLFVSTSGSDSNDGKSQGNAVKTISKAMQLATEYTRIRIMTGKYTETVRIQKNNIRVEPFGNGDVEVVGAIPEFINGVSNWEYVQPGIYKSNLGRVDHNTNQSNTVYTGDGKQWWSYNSLFGLLNRITKNNLPGVRIEHQLFTGFSEVYVATDDNQPPDAPLYIGGAWPTFDVNGVNNITIQGLTNSKLKISYGDNNVQIRNSNNVTVNNTEITGGTYGIYAYDSSYLNLKNNTIKGQFERSWTFADVKNYPASMENAAIIVRANTKNINNIMTEGNTITGYWAGIYYQSVDTLLDPNSPNKYYNENSAIADNVLHDIWGPGLETEAYLRNLVVKGNLVYDAGEAYSPAPVRDGPVYVYENVIIAERVQLDVLGEATSGPGQSIKMNNDHMAPPENIHFYHNTFYYAGNDTNAMKTVHSTDNPLILTQNVSFTNNIFYSKDGVILRGSGRAQDGIEFDGNVFYSPTASAKRYFSWNSFYDQNGTVNNYSSLSDIINGGKMPSQWQSNAEGNPNFNCVDPANTSCFRASATITKPSPLQPIPSGFAESSRLNNRTRIGAFE